MKTLEKKRADWRVVAIALLLCSTFLTAVAARKWFYGARASGASGQIAFLGDSVFGVGASRHSPYYFLRLLLDRMSVATLNYSKPALKSVEAWSALKNDPALERVGTFVIMLGRSDAESSDFAFVLRAMKKRGLPPNELKQLTEIEQSLIRGEMEEALRRLREWLQSPYSPVSKVFVELRLFTLDSSSKDLGHLISLVESLPEAPSAYYQMLLRVVSLRKQHDVQKLLIDKMLSRYGRVSEALSEMAWYETRNGCTRRGLDLFEELVEKDFTLRRFYHLYSCYRTLNETERRQAFIRKIATRPAAPAAIRMLADRGGTQTGSPQGDPRQAYLNELYNLEKRQDWEGMKNRYLSQTEREGQRGLHSSQALASLIYWLLENRKKVVYVSYPNDTVPSAVAEIEDPGFEVLDTKSVLSQFLDRTSVSSLLGDDFEHFSSLGSCLLSEELFRRLGYPPETGDPFTVCRSQG